MVSQVGTQACYDLLQVIEHQVEKPMDAESGQALHHALEMIDQLANVATRVNIFAKDCFAEIHDQIVKLYGEVDTRVMEFEVEAISQEAEHLSSQAGNLTAAVSSLKDHINTFLDSYCPSIAQRRVIAMALERADALAQGKDLNVDELAYMAAEAILEEGIEDPQYARYLLKQLSKEAREKLAYYMRSSQGITDLLHDIESTGNDAPSLNSQDKIVSFADHSVGLKA